jgi:hypothetical protein
VTHRNTPSWWREVDPPRYPSEEDRSRAKFYACGQVLGFLLNLPSTADEAERVRGWLSPDDFPGVLHAVALRLWDTPYDGDPHSIALSMIADGLGSRIGNGALISDLYWNASLASVERAAFVVRTIRAYEAQVAQAEAALARLQ